MIRLLINLYRRLDVLQRENWFRIAASALVLLVCGVLFGSLIATSYSIDSQRMTLYSVLDGQNLRDRDAYAVALLETGEITVNERTYRIDAYASDPRQIFDDQGNIAVLPYLVEDLLTAEIPGWAPDWLLEQPQTTWLLATVVTLWLLLIIWMSITVAFILTALGTAVPVFLAWFFGREQLMLAVAGIGMLTFTYVLLTRTFLAIYQRPNQVLAVAHTVLKEASRSRLSLVFIILLLITLPMLPLWLDPEAPLRYRVQTFISRSLFVTFALAGCMTVFLACATVAFEIRDRQIWHLMTKPMNRFSYLLGKWLGVVTVNVVLLLVAGVSTFMFIQYLRTTPVAPGLEGQMDVVQMETEVLTARVSKRPTYARLDSAQVTARVDQMIDSDPELAAQEITADVRRDLADRIRQQHDAAQRSIPPMSVRQYEFSGLQQARHTADLLVLRYRFFILDSSQHETYPVRFAINEDPRTVQEETYVPTMSHVLRIRPEFIREDGTMTITVANMYQPRPTDQGSAAIRFEADDFELLYRVGSFEGNFFRAITVGWVKLAFLAMLGIFCATFLSFSVACLLSFTIFIAGEIGPYLADAVDYYHPPGFSEIDATNVGVLLVWAFQTAASLISQGVVVTLSPFGDLNPVQSLVQGRLIAWRDVGIGSTILLLVWSGVALIVGYFVMKSRQLAIYSGHG